MWMCHAEYVWSFQHFSSSSQACLFKNSLWWTRLATAFLSKSWKGLLISYCWPWETIWISFVSLVTAPQQLCKVPSLNQAALGQLGELGMQNTYQSAECALSLSPGPLFSDFSADLGCVQQQANVLLATLVWATEVVFFPFLFSPPNQIIPFKIWGFWWLISSVHKTEFWTPTIWH